MIKSLTEKRRSQLTKLYISQMSPTDDSCVPCEPDGHCPACGGTLSYSARGWAFCRVGSCHLFGKMQRGRILDRAEAPEVIERPCLDRSGRLIWMPGEEK